MNVRPSPILDPSDNRPIVWLREEYRHHLRATIQSEHTVRNRFNAVNHAFLRLTPADVASPRMRFLYWESLSPALRRISGTGWAHYREWAATKGFDIPEFPQKPRMRYPHPLFSDLTRLAGVYGTTNLPTMTWANLDAAEPADYRLAERIFAFLTGGAIPLRWQPIVPKDDRMEPMPEWGIEAIINSADPDATRDAERLMVDFIEASFPAKLSASELRECALLLTRTHDRLRRAKDPRKLTGDVLAKLRMGDYSGSKELLSRLATAPEPDESSDLW